MVAIAVLSLIFAFVTFLQGMNVHIDDKRVVIYFTFTVVFTLLGCIVCSLV